MVDNKDNSNEKKPSNPADAASNAKPDASPAPDATANAASTKPSAPSAGTAPLDLTKVIPELKKQQEELQFQVNNLQGKIQMLEQAFHENDLLRTECEKLTAEFKALETADWKIKEVYFPDIYLSYRIKLAEKMKK